MSDDPLHADPEMTAVLRTRDQSLLMAFQAALHAAEIPHFVRGAEAASLMGLTATVVVPRAYLEAAQALLEPAQVDEDFDALSSPPHKPPDFR